MESKKNRGFSITELLIVIAIIAIVGSIASFAWQRYVDNSNLRTAVRDIQSDIEYCKSKAISENRLYVILFISGTNSIYALYSPATATHSLVFTTKQVKIYGSGVRISSASYVDSWATNFILIQPRGTMSPGRVILTNSRSSTATITSNLTGKTFATFSMQ